MFLPSCRYGCPSLQPALCGENYLDGYDKVRHLDLDDVWFVLEHMTVLYVYILKYPLTGSCLSHLHSVGVIPMGRVFRVLTVNWALGGADESPIEESNWRPLPRERI